jgi:hypothetical protein
VEAGPFVIGTDSDCDLILADRTVSARHCEFVREEDAVTIEGNRWLSYEDALAQGLTSDAPNVGSGMFEPFVPPVDADTTAMLSSALWRPNPPNGEGFRVHVPLRAGSFDVFLWTGEDHVDSYRDMNILLQGTEVGFAIGDLPKFRWMRYGPYRADVASATSAAGLELVVVRATKGDPTVSGFAIFTAP